MRKRYVGSDHAGDKAEGRGLGNHWGEPCQVPDSFLVGEDFDCTDCPPNRRIRVLILEKFSLIQSSQVQQAQSSPV